MYKKRISQEDLVSNWKQEEQFQKKFVVGDRVRYKGRLAKILESYPANVYTAGEYYIKYVDDSIGFAYATAEELCPVFGRKLKCECGAVKTWGSECPLEWHSLYCPKREAL